MSEPAGEPAYRQVARLLAERIAEERPGYTPGYVLPAQHEMARQMRLGVDAIREAYQLLASMGLVTLRQGYGAVVRTPRERQTITVPPGTTVTARMPTFAEQDEWKLEPGVPVLVAGNQAWPADRYELVVGADQPS